LKQTRFFNPSSSISFVLKQKKRSKRKIQGCDKKTKKRLCSAKVVKLALFSQFMTENQISHLISSFKRLPFLCSNTDAFLTLLSGVFLHVFFSMPWAAALGFRFGFSKPNDFRRKSSARWAEHLPGKRGQVRWIGMKKSPVDFSIVRRAENKIKSSGLFNSPQGRRTFSPLRYRNIH
jgi:hypothetical protein